MDQPCDIGITSHVGIIVVSCMAKYTIVIGRVVSDVGIWTGWSVGEIEGLTVRTSGGTGVLN